jgi:hypothetical protein
MRRYWERAANRAEQESETMRREAGGARERIEARAQERAEQARPSGGD